MGEGMRSNSLTRIEDGRVAVAVQVIRPTLSLAAAFSGADWAMTCGGTKGSNRQRRLLARFSQAPARLGTPTTRRLLLRACVPARAQGSDPATAVVSHADA
jgi:hypothetical protein